jgi:mevalonate kinase
MIYSFRANGKLLLSGEYTVLDGAKALAIPTKLGQTLNVTQEDSNQRKLSWKSFNHDGTLWFEVLFDKNLQILHADRLDVAERLQDLLVKAIQANPDFYAEQYWYEAETHLEFNREWGLGSSSTLVSLVAQWAQIDAFDLLQNTFGGSGYDVMCATTQNPITFQLIDGKPVVDEVDFNPPFKEQLSFYYTGNKQYSNKEVTRYRELEFDRSAAVQQINRLTENFIACTSLEEFQSLIEEHENLMSKVLNISKAKDVLLPSYEGGVKSLGAWGGDFVLLAGETIIEGSIPFQEMKK